MCRPLDSEGTGVRFQNFRVHCEKKINEVANMQTQVKWTHFVEARTVLGRRDLGARLHSHG